MSVAVLARVLREGPLPWESLACDEDAFLEACRAQEVWGLIYRRQRDAPEFASWPPAVRQALEAEAGGAVARELLVRRELLRVLAALDRRRIHPLLFKGTALAYTCYAHPGLRSRSDTDLLIPPEDRDRTRAALHDLGYSASLLCDGDLLFRQFEMAREDAFGVSHALDVHWAISTQAAFAEVFTYDQLAARAGPAPALGALARVPAELDSLLLALIHPVMHHRNQRRLLWAYDVHLLARTLGAEGFQTLERLAAERRVGAVCADGLRASSDWFGTVIPRATLARLAAASLRELPTARYLAPRRSWAHETVASLGALPRWGDRLRLLREIALPSPAYILRAYRIEDSALGRTLLPALYLHRGVRGAMRALSGRK